MPQLDRTWKDKRPYMRSTGPVQEHRQRYGLSDPRVLEEAEKDIVSLLKTEQEIKEWNEKFRTTKWQTEEKARIKRFNKISTLIDGLENDPYLPEKKVSMSFDDISGTTKPFSQRSYMDDPEFAVETKMVKAPEPDVDKKEIQLAVQRLVPKYEQELNELLQDAEKNKPDFTNSTDEEAMQQLEDWTEYWRYLNYMRSGYGNVYTATKEHKDYPSVKILHTHINLEVRKIDYQFHMRRKTNLFRKRIR